MMDADEAASAVDSFLKDYIPRQSYFRESLKKPYPDASGIPFDLQLAYAASDDAIVVNFRVDGIIAIRDPHPAIQEAAKKCIEALTSEYPELKDFKFKIEYCK